MSQPLKFFVELPDNHPDEATMRYLANYVSTSTGSDGYVYIHEFTNMFSGTFTEEEINNIVRILDTYDDLIINPESGRIPFYYFRVTSYMDLTPDVVEEKFIAAIHAHTFPHDYNYGDKNRYDWWNKLFTEKMFQRREYRGLRNPRPEMSDWINIPFDDR